MKLYVVTYQTEGDHPSGHEKEWFGSKREADKRAAELRREAKSREKLDWRDDEAHNNFDCSLVFGVRPCDVPTDKIGLICFLNDWTNT